MGGEALFDDVEVDFEPLGGAAEGFAAKADAGEVALDLFLGEGDLIGWLECLLVLLEDSIECHGGGAVGDGDLLEGLFGAFEFDAGGSESFGGFIKIDVHAGADGLERGFLGVSEGGGVVVFDHPGILGGLSEIDDGAEGRPEKDRAEDEDEGEEEACGEFPLAVEGAAGFAEDIAPQGFPVEDDVNNRCD